MKSWPASTTTLTPGRQKKSSSATPVCSLRPDEQLFTPEELPISLRPEQSAEQLSRPAPTLTYEAKEKVLGSDVMRELERVVLLQSSRSASGWTTSTPCTSCAGALACSAYAPAGPGGGLPDLTGAASYSVR